MTITSNGFYNVNSHLHKSELTKIYKDIQDYEISESYYTTLTYMKPELDVPINTE